MKASNLIGGISMAINAQTDSYTLTASDAGKHVIITKATAVTLTIPLESSVYFDVGTIIEVEQGGAGAVTITPATVGVTLHSAGALLATNGQYAVVRLLKTAADVWSVSGNRV